MHPPYHRVQQAHCHGDVCFWPVKALSDYIEASNDLSFLESRIGYTDPTTFAAVGPDETILLHCDRVVDQCEARFVKGTALVNFGDGDWDDTLQPADPEVRTHMISSWTVALVYHAFRQLATSRQGFPTRAPGPAQCAPRSHSRRFFERADARFDRGRLCGSSERSGQADRSSIPRTKSPVFAIACCP